MKRIFTFLAAVILMASVFAQSPEKMNYQAVIRNSNNQLVTNKAVGMRISILQGSATGTAVYTETQAPTTNANGLVSIEIGGGAGFGSINWANGSYFIKTETDPAGGTTYTITGTTQLLSVPYALHAKKAESITGTITETDPVFGASLAHSITGTDIANWNNKQTQLTAGAGINITSNVISAKNQYYLGQNTLDGIVYYIYIGSDGQQHGLIVSRIETTATWSGGSFVGADRTDDGAYNTNLMPIGVGTAHTWVESLSSGWYLPSIDELSLLWHNRYHVNKTARAISSTLLSNTGGYWSSSEYNASTAFVLYFDGGSTNNLGKTSTYNVRAVRAF